MLEAPVNHRQQVALVDHNQLDHSGNRTHTDGVAIDMLNDYANLLIRLSTVLTATPNHYAYDIISSYHSQHDITTAATRNSQPTPYTSCLIATFYQQGHHLIHSQSRSDGDISSHLFSIVHASNTQLTP